MWNVDLEIPAVFLFTARLCVPAKQPKPQIPQPAIVWRRASVFVCEKEIKVSVHSGALTGVIKFLQQVYDGLVGFQHLLKGWSRIQSQSQSFVQPHFNMNYSKLETRMRRLKPDTKRMQICVSHSESSYSNIYTYDKSFPHLPKYELRFEF